MWAATSVAVLTATLLTASPAAAQPIYTLNFTSYSSCLHRMDTVIAQGGKIGDRCVYWATATGPRYRLTYVL